MQNITLVAKTVMKLCVSLHFFIDIAIIFSTLVLNILIDIRTAGVALTFFELGD